MTQGCNHAENLREIAETLRTMKQPAAAHHTERAADEIERLLEALRLARKDLLSAVELINVELANEQPAGPACPYHPWCQPEHCSECWKHDALRGD
jgi:hypothetical protein